MSDPTARPQSPYWQLISALKKPGVLLGLLTVFAGFITWVMSRAYIRRTGLEYAWFSTGDRSNLGALTLDTLFDLAGAIAWRWVFAAIAVATALLIGGHWQRSRLTAFVRRRPRLPQLLRVFTLVAIVAVLFPLYLIPSTKITSQLVNSPLRFVGTDVGDESFTTRIARWQQKLQVCAEVGEMSEALARFQITCSGSPSDSPHLASRTLQKLYVGYVLAVFAVVLLALPDLRAALSWVLRESTPTGVLNLPLRTLLACFAVFMAASVAWIYVMLRGDVGPKYGEVPGTECRGYEIPAAAGSVILYDPVRPLAGYQFDEKKVMLTSGPRPNALAALLAEGLSPQDLTGYKTCEIGKSG
jgi:hypothetical protein